MIRLRDIEGAKAPDAISDVAPRDVVEQEDAFSVNRSLAEYGRFMEDFAPLFDKIRQSGQAVGRDLEDLLEFSERVARIE